MNTFDIVLGIIILSVVLFISYKYRKEIKKKIVERIERNSIKIPNATYTDRSGKEHTEDIVIKRSLIPFIGDWLRIYPVVDEDDNLNKINLIFGGRKNLIKLLVILGIIGLIFLAFYEIFNSYEALKNTCEPYLNIIGK